MQQLTHEEIAAIVVAVRAKRKSAIEMLKQDFVKEDESIGDYWRADIKVCESLLTKLGAGW